MGPANSVVQPYLALAPDILSIDMNLVTFAAYVNGAPRNSFKDTIMSKLSFEIRLFDQADLPRLHQVRNAAFATIYRSFRSLLNGTLAEVIFADAEDAQGAHLDEICRKDSHHQVFVAIHKDQVIGFCGASLSHEAAIGTVGLNAVHPDFSDQGVGTALYEHVLTWMKNQGATAAQVSTGDDPSHLPARKAYEKAGFEKSIPTRSYYRRL